MNEHEPREYDQQPRPTINQLLPRYYEIYPNWHYQALELYDVGGHEVAWMKMTSRDSAQPYECHVFKCACDFTEGVGWAMHEQYGAVTLGQFEQECQPRQTVTDQRHQDMKVVYDEQFGQPLERGETIAKVQAIILDLIAKDAAGEFIGEQGNGAHFWGGHFYLQTVECILGGAEGEAATGRWRTIWAAVDGLMQQKKIQLEGMVVQDYYEPPAPSWVPYDTIDYRGYTSEVSLPAHGHMVAQWHFTIIDASGAVVLTDQQGPKLQYEPTFGPDIQDVNSIKTFVHTAIDRIIDSATNAG